MLFVAIFCSSLATTDFIKLVQRETLRLQNVVLSIPFCAAVVIISAPSSRRNGELSDFGVDTIAHISPTHFLLLSPSHPQYSLEMAHHILVASYSNDIVTLTFDPKTASLDVTSSTTVGHHPSWIASHPSHPSIVWTGLEQYDGKILALTHDDTGFLDKVAEVTSGGRDPCCLLALENEVLVANYSSGSVAVLPVSGKPLKFAASPSIVQLSGVGPNKSRQESSHPHQVILHEEYQEIFVPDLGSDCVCRLKKDKDGSWKLAGHVGIEAGGGPRHVAFYKGDMFTLLELTSKVVRHRLPPLPEFPKFIKSVPTMSNPPPTPNDMLAAEILIPTPNASFPTPYLYLSNRNDPSPEGDIISIFSIEEPDSLELIAEVRTGLKHVRGIVFGGPDDRYLIAGGANGGGVKMFERINGGKSLKEIASNDSVQAPTGFLWL
ncbi:putative 6-phosphogluconolactonase [Psilocybe cubensis]|uniref:6-phosphogluconolactonase n=2 Tax=Psilocybe cubensis TaxID=181762 RepID=A0A8H7Y407_PSICU|nr:putative 6-phosphogluconolactonase [Psilocybe cubensis]KAH9485787.1 putative 6-phosphogluconolactonase [Psilocybe cubensis]